MQPAAGRGPQNVARLVFGLDAPDLEIIRKKADWRRSNWAYRKLNQLQLEKFAKFEPLFEEKINQITLKYLEYYAAVMWPWVWLEA